MKRFAIDENVPIGVVELLKQAGHEACTVADLDRRGAPDATLTQVCNAERRTLITHDLEFASILAYPPQQHAGLIVLRLAHQDAPIVLEAISRMLPLIKSETVNGTVWVVEDARVRIRSAG